MSLIKKSDVKNHLSARHHSKIHLQPQSLEGAAGLALEEPAGADPEGINPLEGQLDIESSRGQQSVPIVTPKNIQS